MTNVIVWVVVSTAVNTVLFNNNLAGSVVTGMVGSLAAGVS